ncbi:pyrroline-5-carboxylate reductase [Anaerosacchariphilus polymeriproducens]|uniref:Pyrroline-5-carboxylate reductase n=1 Tax=Anaerosacchariphilus polymeriproducens TaxID=1812858 RepID=A0A371B042_9FIRM|nr:pyrroline-5-carboxylate reductase [Anaerosacchariphilus polymeriproducens]RDU25238.1 pyrroline-5-carboxylate reductase [Anaerosacchariphilus polymeriproducens]
MATIGFIGMGNMGYAMLKGILNVFPKEEIIFSNMGDKRNKEVEEETEVKVQLNNKECASKAKYIILAIKPQQYQEVLEEIEDELNKNHVILSIAPGITIKEIKGTLGKEKRIVRAMPNTPALLGEGMTGISYDETEFSIDESEIIGKIFSSFGRFIKVEEKLMSAVVCASGSSPAYVYMFIEALADSVVKYGLPRDKAYEFVAQTVKGSAQMVLETGKHPGELKDQVCSPGGTTIAGVAALEEFGLRNALFKASDACFNKSEKLK